MKQSPLDGATDLLAGTPSGAAVAFTPWLSLGGGVLIGLSALVVFAGVGKIAGVSGITDRAMHGAAGFGEKGDTGWRWAFLVGLVAGAAIVFQVWPELHGFAITTDTTLLVVAGLLVGLGTRIGGGCTSGHGVCGMGRANGKSTAATCIFMAVAIATVLVTRHVIGGGA